MINLVRLKNYRIFKKYNQMLDFFEDFVDYVVDLFN